MYQGLKQVNARETCDWQQDGNGIWDTACEQTFEFNDGGPAENDFRFCPYCGLALNAVPPTLEEELRA